MPRRRVQYTVFLCAQTTEKEDIVSYRREHLHSSPTAFCIKWTDRCARTPIPRTCMSVIREGTGTSTKSSAVSAPFPPPALGARSVAPLKASGPRPRASARRSAQVARVVGRDVMARVRGAHGAVWPERGSGAGLRRLDAHRLDLARSRRTG